MKMITGSTPLRDSRKTSNKHHSCKTRRDFRHSTLAPERTPIRVLSSDHTPRTVVLAIAAIPPNLRSIVACEVARSALFLTSTGAPLTALLRDTQGLDLLQYCIGLPAFYVLARTG